MKVILIGSTGLVGSEVLKLLIADQTVTEVVTPVRTLQPAHTKQKVIVYDFDKCESIAEFQNADAIICTLGTTIKKVKTKEAFRKVDFEYPFNFAKMGKSLGIKHFLLNSAMGANAHSKIFYNQVKGEIENEIRKLNFDKYTIVRPGLIGGDRQESRPGEYAAKIILATIGFLLPKSLRINPAKSIAAAIVNSLHDTSRKETIITSEQMI